MVIKFSTLSAVLTQGINLYISACFVSVDAERQKYCKNHQYQNQNIILKIML